MRFRTVCSLILFVSASLGAHAKGLSTIQHKRRLIGDPVGVPDNARPAKDLWFNQKLDHFDILNNATWKQRYQVNASFFDPKPYSPVFLMVGGEGSISAKWMAAGAWKTYSEQFGALCFQLEHRYYGKSWPAPDMSTENLRYLSSEQALADIAYFIEGMKKEYRLNELNKWILFGGSYPGSLVAWARSKYPHLVHGSVSSSAPLEALLDFRKYNEVVEQSLESSNPNCAKQVHRAALHLEKLVENPVTSDSISNMFKLCEPLDVSNRKDVSTLAESLAGYFDETVQYNKDNRITSDPIPAFTIDDLCSRMMRQTIGPALARYASVNAMMMLRANQSCLDVSYDSMIQSLQNVTFDNSEGAGGRQWTYQTCTEFGFFQTSSTRKELFGSLYDADYFVNQCADIFGPQFTKQRLLDGIERTNILYGGLNIRVSRVLFVHGSIDPWHALGITNSTKLWAPALFIKGTAHCADMYPSSTDDLPALTAARDETARNIRDWLLEN